MLFCNSPTGPRGNTPAAGSFRASNQLIGRSAVAGQTNGARSAMNGSPRRKHQPAGQGERPMLSDEDVRTYREQGYIVVPNVLTPEEVAGLREATDQIVAGAAEVSDHNAVYDLEAGHTPETPKVRRINNPHMRHPAFGAMV